MRLQPDGKPFPGINIRPTTWTVLEQFYPSYGTVSGGITIEERNGENGRKYAVYMRQTWCLSKSGKIDHEPIPSSRTKAYLKSHRFDTFEEAKAAAEKLAARCLKERP